MIHIPSCSHYQYITNQALNHDPMTHIDPIIAVRDVEASSEWYQQVFGCKSMHGGSEFDVLVTQNEEVMICLHKWGAHGHPTMITPGTNSGNGLILYFRTENMKGIRQNLEKIGSLVDQDIQLNPNSGQMEFSFRDPDGYYWTISEFHTYQG
jgi:uncharacterized glyoxalase superfamily protein PhnB